MTVRIKPGTSGAANLRLRQNGSNLLTQSVELINATGKTTSDPLVVKVTDASPGIPVLSHDNWDGDGNYMVSMNMWWGTNATIYKWRAIDTKELAVKTPQAQSAAANIQGRKPGTCEYWAELVNDSGKVSSKTITVEAKDR